MSLRGGVEGNANCVVVKGKFDVTLGPQSLLGPHVPFEHVKARP